MTPIPLQTFAGASASRPPRLLAAEVGAISIDQRPGQGGVLMPWTRPEIVAGHNIPAGRKTLYRMGHDGAAATSKHLYWLSWTGVVSVIRGFDATDTTERTVFTGFGSPKWTNNLIGLATAPFPTAARELAVPQPDVAPVAALVTDGDIGGTAATVYWAFTIVDDIGRESAPSPASVGVVIKPGAVVDLSASYSIPPGNYGISKIRWYASQTDDAGNAEFMFVREYPWGSAGMQDDGRDRGEVLITETWLPLDASAANLTAFGSQLAAATVGKTVRWCEPGYDYAWPLSNEYILNHDPVAMAAFGQRLVVMTNGGITVMTGVDPAAMDAQDVDAPPCLSARSVVSTDYGVVWASADGIIWYGSDGLRNLTAGWIKPEDFRAKYNPAEMHGAFYKGLFMFWFSGGSAGSGGFVVDPANADGGYFLSEYQEAAHWDKFNRRLFVFSGGQLKEWQPDVGEPMTVTFKSKVWHIPLNAEPEMIEVLCESATPVNVKLYADGALVMNRTVTSGEHRVPDGVYGRDLQLELSTAGDVTYATIY